MALLSPSVRRNLYASPLAAPSPMSAPAEQPKQVSIRSQYGIGFPAQSPDMTSILSGYGVRPAENPQGFTWTPRPAAPVLDPNPDPDPGGQGAGGYPADPGILAAQNAENLGVSQLDSSLRSARERAIINFGDPALADMAGFGLDPQAAAFARQNYLSGNATLSRLDKAHTLGRQAVINRLASHGILHSGDLGYGEGQENEQYGHQVYDARTQLIEYLANLYQQYLDRKQGLHNSILSAYQGAYGNALPS